VPFHRSVNTWKDASNAPPTAKQFVALVHDTPDSKPDTAFPVIDHAMPFHRSMSVFELKRFSPTCPTAKQWVVLVHDTPKRELLEPATEGLATIDHVAPFIRSIKVPFPDLPTAKQLVVLVQETLASELLDAPAGLGLATIDQLVPFQRSMSVCVPELFVDWPTATQLVALTHDTPASELAVVPPGFGLARSDQLVPFHRSTSVRTDPDGATYLPTAKQLVVLGHEVPVKSATGGPGGFGLATNDQLVPFQISVSVWLWSTAPTAAQLAVLVHDTDAS
jgi:hypothetical protein